MLTVNRVSVRYGDFAAVNDLSFRLEEGQWLMLAGPNGAGKSTLIEAIAQGVPYTGGIQWEGTDIRSLKPAQLARRIGVLSQKHTVGYAYTVEEVVGLGRYAYKSGFFSGKDDGGKTQVERALALTGLTELRRASMLTLSGGETQRVFLAQTLAQDPQTILLDEPTNHLDVKHQVELVDYLRDWCADGQHTVVGVLHDVNLALHLSHMVLFMSEGRIVRSGDFTEIADAAFLNSIYGMDLSGYMRQSLALWRDIP